MGTAERHVRRRWWPVAVVTLLVLAACTAASSFTTPAYAGDPLDKVDQAVLNQVSAGGQATFWVILRDQADLEGATGIGDRASRKRFVYEKLTETAATTQAPLIAELSKLNVSFQSFWIVNTIKVTAGEAVLRMLAEHAAVERIIPDGSYEVPKPEPGSSDPPEVQTVEWGIANINADDVWATFGARGEGIVVANIDTGVQFDHSALVAQYRGNQGGGNFDHNYNWHDPSNVCGNPSLVPCDNNGHGTHTMGTMVGDDGDPGPNQIGVAPHARWMAAKGCESSSCSFTALLSSGQWVMAPTDLNGQNPRPDLAADVVNNSWGGGPGDPFYQGIVDSWNGAGIFPAFANGNAGPSCGSVGSPGDYVNSYGVGAYDINNNIAGFSSRGPSAFGGGEIKPNIAAPGVNVRSSVPGNGYANFSGTSMATPHLAGSVALMWSAAPALIGDIGETRRILDDTAVDTSDLSCGGTADDNNVFGEGRLDVLAAVEQSPTGPAGTLTGTVTAAGGGPIAGARVRVTGPTDRLALTNAAGQYTMTNLPVGTYTATANAFGYGEESAQVTIVENQTTTQNFTLDPVPSHPVSGTVSDQNNQPIAGATVTILQTPIPPATTDANGNYSFAAVPEGTYDVRAEGGRCTEAQTQTLVVDGPEDLDFSLQARHDNFGYRCSIVPISWIDANTVLPLSGDDASLQISLPFPFTFYGETHNVAHVSTNGFFNFLAPNATFSNSGIPSTFPPNGAIYPYWDDMYVDGSASVRTELLGSAPNRRFVIEWRNVAYFADFSRRVDFEVVLTETGRILTQYRNIANDGREMGNSATVGIENQTGTDAFQYSLNEPALTDNLAVLYRLPPSAFVAGVITDDNDDLPLAGALIRALQGGNLVRQTESNAAGEYRLQLPLGDYTIEVSKQYYGTQTRNVSLVIEDNTYVENFALKTPRAEVSPTSFELIVPAGQTRHRTLTLENTGSLPMQWEIAEAGGGRVSTSSTQGLVKNPAYNPNSPTTEGLYANPVPGWGPTSPGDIIRQWQVAGFTLPWGVGYDGDVWFSDPLAGGNLCAFVSTCHIAEFTVAGTPTGVDLPADWAGAWNGDMALDTTNNCMAEVNVGGDNGIYCMDLGDGHVVYSITTGPWTGISQRGLAYRPDDNSFYIGGWNEGIVYHIRGEGPGEGEVIDQCSPSDRNISGLTWNGAFNILWEATNSPSDTIYELNPANCAVLTTLPHPTPGFAGAGIEMDEEGNLWTVSQANSNAYLIESGVPAFSDVPWLSESPASGSLDPGQSVDIDVTVDTTGLEPGVYSAIIFVRSNSGRRQTERIPVRLIVPAYRVGVDAGAGSAYLDTLGDTWATDQAFDGFWGYIGTSGTASTRAAISGTTDDALYQTARRATLGFSYRFTGLIPGVYQVELRFAEIQNRRPGRRLFDVTINDTPVLIGYDIAAHVGLNAADDKTFWVNVTGGEVLVQFAARRSFGEPIVNALRVTHRPDR